MSRGSPFNVIGTEFRAPSGALAVGEIVFFDPHGEDLTKFMSSLVHLHITTITTPDADDEIDFFLQTAYDANGAPFTDTALNLLDAVGGAADGIVANQEMSLHSGAIGAEPGDILRLGNERMFVVAMDSPVADFVLVRRGYEGDPVQAHAAAGVDIFRQAVTWEDVANAHFALADNGNTAEVFIAIGQMAAGVATFTHSDLALADDTNRDLPLGDRLRLVTVLTGATAPTYAYSAFASFFAHV